MGSKTSRPAEYYTITDLSKFNPKILQDCKCVGYYHGGGSGDFTLQTIEGYADSVTQQTIRDIFKRLALSVKDMGFDIKENASTSEIIEAFQRQFPLRENGKEIVSDSKSQEKICRVVADSLNKIFTPSAVRSDEKFIDTTLSASDMCDKVNQKINLLIPGLHIHFAGVYENLKKIASDIRFSHKLIIETFHEIIDRVKTGDYKTHEAMIDELSYYINGFDTKQNKLLLDLDRVLQLNLGPISRDFELIVDETKVEHENLKAISGSNFVNSLMFSFKGFLTAAQIMDIIDKNLTKIGDDIKGNRKMFMESKEFKDFSDKFEKKILESNLVDPSKLSEFIKAMEKLRLIYNGIKQRDDVKVEYSERVATGRGEVKGGAESKIERENKKNIESKKLIIWDFSNKVNVCYGEINDDLKVIIMKIGKEIKTSDLLFKLKESVINLKLPYKNPEYILLSNSKSPPDLKVLKETYMNNLQSIILLCENIIESPLYSSSSRYFSDLKTKYENLLKTIEYFSEALKQQNSKNLNDEIVASATSATSVKSSLLNKEKFASYSVVVKKFKSQYYIALMKEELTSSSKEILNKDTKYNTLLTTSISSIYYNLDKEQETEIGKITTYFNTISTRGLIVPGFNNGNALPQADFDKLKTDLIANVRTRFNTIKKFIDAVRSVEIYLMSFNCNISKDPESVLELSKMYFNAKFIPKYYDDKTIKSLCEAFDLLNSYDTSGSMSTSATNRSLDDKHYYSKFGTDKLAGTPAQGFDLNKSTYVAMKISEVFNNFHGLKNLISAFYYIGEIYNPDILKTKQVLSPNNVFINITEYLKASSISANTTTADITNSYDIPTYVNGASRLYGSNDIKTRQFYFSRSRNTCFEEYDGLLVDTIKAISAKVLTVVRTFELMQSGVDEKKIKETLNTRLIIGGSDITLNPEPIPAAAALYCRLPRLAKFYVKIFTDTRGRTIWGTEEFFVKMASDFTGIFAGFHKLMFVQIKSNQYNESELRMIVDEINNIYTYFKKENPNDTIKATISAYVNDVNNKYGAIQKKESALLEGKYKNKSTTYTSEELKENFTDILPGDDVFDSENLFVPTVKYQKYDPDTGLPLSVDGSKYDPFKDKSATIDQIKGMIVDFREKIQDYFKKVPDDHDAHSTDLVITKATKELEMKRTKEEKLSVVAKLIKTADTSSADSKKQLMFHETIMLGLNILNIINTLIEDFSSKMKLLSEFRKYVLVTIYGLQITGGTLQKFAANTFSPITAAANNDVLKTVDTFYKALQKVNELKTDDGEKYLYGDHQFIGTRQGFHPVKNNIFIEYGKFYHLFEKGVAAARTPGAPTNKSPISDYDLADAQFNDAKLLSEVGCDLFINYGKMLQDFIEYTYEIGGIVDIKLDEKHVDIDFTNLKVMTDTLFADVKRMFSSFRPQMDKKHIGFFEDVSKKGSIQWIEKHLMYEKFTDSDSPDFVDKISEKATNVLKMLSGKKYDISKLHGDIVEAKNLDMSSTTDNTLEVKATATDLKTKLAECKTAFNDTSVTDKLEYYGGALSRMLYYDVSEFDPYFNSGLGEVEFKPLESKLKELISKSSDGKVELDKIETKDTTSMNLYDVNFKSLLFDFNKLAFKYLDTLSDSSNGSKIYLPLINPISNGVLAYSISDPLENAFPDIVHSDMKNVFGIRGDPKFNAIVFSSLAYIMQRMTKDSNKNNSMPKYVVPTLTDIPLYIKEIYKANLPLFVKLFDALASKAEYIKHFISKTKINTMRQDIKPVIKYLYSDAKDSKGADNNERTMFDANYDGNKLPFIVAVEDKNYEQYKKNTKHYETKKGFGLDVYNAGDGTGSADIATANTHRTTPLLPNEKSKFLKFDDRKVVHRDSLAMYVGGDHKSYIFKFLDSVINSCGVFSSASSEVLRELSYTPVYGQIRENFLESYRLKNGHSPLTPLTLMFKYSRDSKEDKKGSMSSSLFSGYKTYTDENIDPKKSIGTPEFQLLYGVGGYLFNDSDSSLDQLSCVQEQYMEFNNQVGRRDAIDDSLYNRFIRTSMKLLRYVVDIRSFKSSISTSTLCTKVSDNTDVKFGLYTSTPTATDAYCNMVYPLLETNDFNLVSVIENKDTKESVDTILEKIVHTSSSKNSDEADIMKHIIDMNIMPINIYALMGYIPFTFIYNYSYTFDKYVEADFHQLTNISSYTSIVNDAQVVDHTKKHYVKLLQDPFFDVSTDAFGLTKMDASGHHKLLGQHSSISPYQRMIDGSVSDVIVSPFLKKLFGSVLFGSEIRLHVPDSKEYNKQFISGLTRNHELTSGASLFIKKIDELLKVLSEFKTDFNTELTNYCNETRGTNPRVLIHLKGRSTAIVPGTLKSDIIRYLSTGTLPGANDNDIKEFTERFMLGNSMVVFYAFKIKRMIDEIISILSNAVDDITAPPGSTMDTELKNILAECKKYTDVFEDETYLGFEGKSIAHATRLGNFGMSVEKGKDMIDELLNHDYKTGPLTLTNKVNINGVAVIIDNKTKNGINTISAVLYRDFGLFSAEVKKVSTAAAPIITDIKTRVAEIDNEVTIITTAFNEIADDKRANVTASDAKINGFKSEINNYYNNYTGVASNVTDKPDMWYLLTTVKDFDLTTPQYANIEYIQDSNADELINVGFNVTGKYVDSTDVKTATNIVINTGDAKWSSIVRTVMTNNNAGGDYNKLYGMFNIYIDRQIAYKTLITRSFDAKIDQIKTAMKAINKNINDFKQDNVRIEGILNTLSAAFTTSTDAVVNAAATSVARPTIAVQDLLYDVLEGIRALKAEITTFQGLLDTVTNNTSDAKINAINNLASANTNHGQHTADVRLVITTNLDAKIAALKTAITAEVSGKITYPTSTDLDYDTAFITAANAEDTNVTTYVTNAAGELGNLDPIKTDVDAKISTKPNYVKIVNKYIVDKIAENLLTEMGIRYGLQKHTNKGKTLEFMKIATSVDNIDKILSKVTLSYDNKTGIDATIKETFDTFKTGFETFIEHAFIVKRNYDAIMQLLRSKYSELNFQTNMKGLYDFTETSIANRIISLKDTKEFKTNTTISYELTDNFAPELLYIDDNSVVKSVPIPREDMYKLMVTGKQRFDTRIFRFIQMLTLTYGFVNQQLLKSIQDMQRNQMDISISSIREY